MYYLGYCSARPTRDHLTDRMERPRGESEEGAESTDRDGEVPGRDREEPIWPLVSREELALIAFAPFLRS